MVHEEAGNLRQADFFFLEFSDLQEIQMKLQERSLALRFFLSGGGGAPCKQGRFPKRFVAHLKHLCCK